MTLDDTHATPTRPARTLRGELRVYLGAAPGVGKTFATMVIELEAVA